MVGGNGAVIISGGNGGGIPTPNWFNVKKYGAKGNTKCVADAVASGTNTVTSATANFTQADVGKVCYAVYSPTGNTTYVPQGFITAVVNSTTITVSTTVTPLEAALQFVWGTDDTVALKAAWTAALAAASSVIGSAGNLNGMGTVYVPAGGYLFSSLPFSNQIGNGETIIPRPGVSLLGDGPNSTVFYTVPNYNFATGGFTNDFGMLLQSFDGATTNEVGKFSFYGAYIEWGNNGYYGGIVDLSGVTSVHDIRLQNLGAGGTSANTIGGIYCAEGAYGTWTNVSVVAFNGAPGNIWGIFINGCNSQVLMQNVWVSNGGPFLILNVNNGTSYENETGGLTLVGSLEDECGPLYSLYIQNSSRITIVGCSLYGNANSIPLTVDGTSDVTLVSCHVGTYAYDLTSNAINILAGGTVRASGCRIYSTGSTGGAVALTNAGTFIDLGGNYIENYTNTGAGQIIQSSYNSTAATATAGAATAVAPAGFTFEMINGAMKKRAYFDV